MCKRPEQTPDQGSYPDSKQDDEKMLSPPVTRDAN